MSTLMRSVSGIRGIVGDPLTPPLLMNYLNAFIQITKAKKVVVGRDTRTTGPMIESLIAQGCCAAGVEPIVLGLASTPTVEMMVTELKADGGIIVTASHNPIEWNALKFLNKEGEFLNEANIKQLFEIVDNNQFKWSGYKGVKSISTQKGGDEHHINSILKLKYINPRLIKKQKFKVAYDGVNGAGSLIVPQLLKKLGCELVAINIEPNGIFPHNPEPTPKNLKQLSELVKKKKCHIGFATDPDADRCAMVSETGTVIGEEYTLALATQLILEKNPGAVTINLSTSRMSEDIAESFGVKVYRAKVGEINVSSQMKLNKSTIGGEGNGGVILPDLHYGRDGILSIALALQFLAEKNTTLTDFVNSIPKYHIEKQKCEIHGKSLENIFGHLLAKFKDAHIDEQDGLRFEWDKKWVHVRSSNTEPIIRIIAEAPNKKEALELCKLVMAEV